MTASLLRALLARCQGDADARRRVLERFNFEDPDKPDEEEPPPPEGPPEPE